MICSCLGRATESSGIRIPIFFEGYADSGWCLTEVATMLTTPGFIIPLVYYADPDKGFSPYKQSFLKYDSYPHRYPREEIDEGKDALPHIWSRSIWSITEGWGVQVKKTVANNLIEMLDTFLLEFTNHPLRMDSVKKALIQKLNHDSVEEVVKDGILGIGGIGKTTVVKAVYNQVYGYFNAASFVFNVRGTAVDAIGFTKLQR
ncbi:hypothetical protein SUGI_1103190 [Cryptomeria japonica]|uniref:disease resistance protein L6 n=1 Tax=Cryptomeria japonica TaxID=3369 RepID=UPI002414CABD|nr:disease resistance protein L6 [Cryptomeria japonica]GLJ51925.1 hypothetical protein SUGI_1103190 [Cryptomeria japonica]